MKLSKIDEIQLRHQRYLRIRAHIHGTAARPLLTFFEYRNYLYAQVIDDEKGGTVIAESHIANCFLKETEAISKVQKMFMADITKKALDAGISKVHLDVGAIKSQEVLSFVEGLVKPV